MLRAILNKSWQQHPTRHQLYGHLPPITKTIQTRGTRHAGHCWRNKDELISDVPQWTPAYGQAKAGWPARTYIQQLCEDTGCSPEELPEAMNDREKRRERVRDILVSGTTWWSWILSDLVDYLELECSAMKWKYFVSYLLFVYLRLNRKRMWIYFQSHNSIIISRSNKREDCVRWSFDLKMMASTNIAVYLSNVCYQNFWDEAWRL